MSHRSITLATERPRTVFVVAALLTIAAAALMFRIRVDTDPENMLPSDQPDRVFHDAVERQFALHDAIVVGIVNETDADGVYNVATLERLHAITDRILEIDGVIAPDLMSLSVADNITQTADGALRFEWMMRDAPTTREQALAVRDAVHRLPLLDNTLVSGDGRAAAVYVPIASKDVSYRIAQEIDTIAADVAGDEGVYVTGLPVAEDTFGVEMFVQMGISAPLAALMIFLLMWFFFRSARLVVAPMIVAVVTVVVTMGLLIGLGFTVHIMSSMIPIFLMPIAVVDSVHIMSEFADKYTPARDLRATVREVVDHLYKPMLFTTITTSVGFASLLLTPIPPVQIFGAFVAFGVLFAFLATITFVPAYVVLMKPGQLAALAKLKPGRHADSPLARGLRTIGRAAFEHGKLITGLTVLILGFSIAGVLRIEINDNPVRWFKQSHDIRIADRVLNDHFAGTYDAFFVLGYDTSDVLSAYRDRAHELIASAQAHGAELDAIGALLDSPVDSSYFGALIAAVDDALFDATPETEDDLSALLSLSEETQSQTRYFQRPEALEAIEGIQQALLASGLVGKTNALPDVVKVVNRELRSGSEADYRLPSSSAGVAQALLQFQSSHRPQDLWHMVTPDYESTAIWIQLTSGDNQDMTRVMQALDGYLGEHPLPLGVTGRWAGKTYINVVWQSAMVKGMLASLLGAFVIVFIMMAVLFRSPSFGLLAMLPLSVTILGVYGLIGWIGKAYDMPIAVLSSLTLGLSVDFAIHFIQRMRSLQREEGSFRAAAEHIFEEPARAIARNAIVIALGFTPLFFAPLVPYVTVGAFMASIMAISGFSTLVLLPAVLSWSHPWLFKSGVDGAKRARADIEALGS